MQDGHNNMAINFNGTTYAGTNSAQNINFNGTNMCAVVAVPTANTCCYMSWLRGDFCYHSNNYAGLEYRIWVANVNTGEICYCFRTCCQDGDSFLCVRNANYTGTYSCVNATFRLVGRGGCSNPTLGFSGRSECASYHYTITIPNCVFADYWNWTCMGAPGCCTWNAPTCSPWYCGSYGCIDKCVAHCFYNYGMDCCVITAARWLPYQVIACIRCSQNNNYACFTCTNNSLTTVNFSTNICI